MMRPNFVFFCLLAHQWEGMGTKVRNTGYNAAMPVKYFSILSIIVYGTASAPVSDAILPTLALSKCDACVRRLSPVVVNMFLCTEGAQPARSFTYRHPGAARHSSRKSRGTSGETARICAQSIVTAVVHLYFFARTAPGPGPAYRSNRACTAHSSERRKCHKNTVSKNAA